MAEEEPLDKGELEAVLETRRELGSSYDAALADSFADRIEATVAARVAGEVAAREHADAARSAAGPRQLALGIVSSVMGVGATAITLALTEGIAEPVTMVIAWGGLVGINAAHAVQTRR